MDDNSAPSPAVSMPQGLDIQFGTQTVSKQAQLLLELDYTPEMTNVIIDDSLIDFETPNII